MTSSAATRWWSPDACGWVESPAPGGLLRGLNHVALVTADTDRLHGFYREVFDASVFADRCIEACGSRSSTSVR